MSPWWEASVPKQKNETKYLFSLWYKIYHDLLYWYIGRLRHKKQGVTKIVKVYDQFIKFSQASRASGFVISYIYILKFYQF